MSRSVFGFTGVDLFLRLFPTPSHQFSNVSHIHLKFSQKNTFLDELKRFQKMEKTLIKKSLVNKLKRRFVFRALCQNVRCLNLFLKCVYQITMKSSATKVTANLLNQRQYGVPAMRVAICGFRSLPFVDSIIIIKASHVREGLNLSLRCRTEQS